MTNLSPTTYYYLLPLTTTYYYLSFSSRTTPSCCWATPRSRWRPSKPSSPSEVERATPGGERALRRGRNHMRSMQAESYRSERTEIRVS
eukprot:scaffold25272_cov32-Phaeocystis_antarctica.AAC.1